MITSRLEIMTTYSKTSVPRKITNTLRVYIFSQDIVVRHHQGSRTQKLPLKEGYQSWWREHSKCQLYNLNNNSYGAKSTHFTSNFVEHLHLPFPVKPVAIMISLRMILQKIVEGGGSLYFTPKIQVHADNARGSWKKKEKRQKTWHKDHLLPQVNANKAAVKMK